MTRRFLRAALSLLLVSASASPVRADSMLETVSPVPLMDGTRVPRVVLGGFRFDSQNRPVVSWYLNDPAGSVITTAAYWSRKEAGAWSQSQFWQFCCLLGTHSHAITVDASDRPWAFYAAPTAFDGYGVYRSDLSLTPDGSVTENVEGIDNYRTPRAQLNVYVPDVAPDAGPSYARSLHRELAILDAAGVRRIAAGSVAPSEFDYVAEAGGRHHVLYAPWIGGTSEPVTNGIFYWDGTDGTVGVRVPSAADGQHLRPTLGLARAGDGTLHAVVNRTFSELGNLERYLFHYTSSDGGTTWSETLLAGYPGSRLHTPSGFASLALQDVTPVEVDVAVDANGTPWIAYASFFDDASLPFPNSRGGNEIGVWLAHPEGGTWTHQRVAHFASDGLPAGDVQLAIDNDGVPAVFFHHKDRREVVIGRASNAPPVLVNPGDQTNSEGDAVTLPVVASDPDGDELTFAAAGLPPGLTIDPATGVISGTLGFDSSGDYAVTVTVSDGLLSASAGFTWTVLNVQDLPVDLSIETRDSPDPAEAGGQLRYVLTVSNRGSTRATGVSVTEQLPADVTFEQATPAPAGQAGGTLTFDVGTLAAGASWSATVTVRTSATGILTHRAEVSAFEPEANPGDNFVLTETRVMAASCFPSSRDGLRGLWHADGDAFDAVGASQGQLEGGLAFTAGRLGQAFDFDGVDDAVEIADRPALRIGETVSIAFWARRQRFGVDIVLEKGGDWTGAETNYGVGLHEANERMLYFFFAGGWRGTAGVADLDWHHYAIVATHGDANPRFFVDGAERAPAYGDGAPTLDLNPSTLPLHLGAQVRDPNGFTYHGQLQLDSVQIYDRALTPAEIAADAAAPGRKECGGPNGPPVLDNPGDQTNDEGATVSLQLTASDPDGDSLTYSAAGLPPGLSVDPVTGLISGQIAPGSAGSYEVTAEVTDSASTAGVTFTWTVVGAPPPTVSIADATANEAAGTALLTLQLSHATNVPVFVDLVFENGSATGGGDCAAGVDYRGLPTRVEIPAGMAAASFGVPICNDATDEPDEGFTARLTNPSGATLGDDVAAVAIVDDDEPTCVPPPPGMISWWRAEDGAVDEVGGNDGTLVNGVAFAPGRVGQAFDLSATNAHLAVGDPDNLRLDGDLTLTAWIHPNVAPTTNNGTWQAIVTKWSQSTATDAYGLWVTFDNGAVRLGGAVGVPGVVDTGMRAGVIPIGAWTHVAMTYERATGLNILYVDGVEVGRRTRFGGPTASNAGVMIGREDSGIPRPFRGLIDEPAVYGRLLSAAEIAALHAAGGAGLCAPTAVATETAVASSLNPSRFGQPVVFTATVNAAGSVVSAGTVTFMEGETILSGPVPLNGLGQASFTTSSLPAGSHAITAVYDGAPGFLPSSAGVTQVVLPAVPALSIGDVTVKEGNDGRTSATFTVTLSAPAAVPVSVRFATADGTASAGRDYLARSATTLTFLPGTTTRTITVKVLGDCLSEADEAFLVRLTGAVNASIADAEAVGTITDDDPRPRVFIDDVTLSEGDGGTRYAVFAVKLSAPAGQAVTLDYATADADATAGSDYAAAAGTLTFAPGTVKRTISVAVRGDSLIEPDERFLVNLSGAVGATIADAQAKGTIDDDDRKRHSGHDGCGGRH